MRKLQPKFLIIPLLVLCLSFNLFAQGNNRISDATETLSTEEISILNYKLNEIEKAHGIAISVSIVKSIEAEDKEKYAIEQLQTWNNVSKTKVLILIVKKDRNLLLATTDDGVFSKKTKADIIGLMIPQFRNGNFLLGIKDGIDSIVVLNKGDDIKDNSTFQLKNYPLISIFFALVLLSILSGFVNSGRIKLVAAVAVAIMFWLAFDSITYSVLILILSLFTLLGRSARGGGGAYGGGYSDGNQGAGSDDGESSFSLGGGTFGGGGASGDWRSFSMGTHKKFNFNDEQRENVAQAIKNLELESSGEIVVYFARKSDSYQEGSWKLAAILGMLGLISVISLSYLWMLPASFSAMKIAVFIFTLIITGVAATYFFPPVRLAFIPLNIMDHRVITKSRDIFLQEEIFNTVDRTGILIFVSELEKRVQVLGDKGISSVIKQDDWNKVLAIVTDGIKQGNPAESLVSAINECKNLLLKNGFIVRADDTNELANEMIIED